jgi:hypothetical protein
MIKLTEDQRHELWSTDPEAMDPFGNLFSIIENPHFKLDAVR